MYVGHAGVMSGDEGDSVRSRVSFSGFEKRQPMFGGNFLKDRIDEGGGIATGL